MNMPGNKNAEIHGYYKTPTHRSWEAMKYRCSVSARKRNKYPHYNAIEVCEEWKDFVNFLHDMGERPEGTTLDRIDNNLGYSKENCRWSTPSWQSHNRKGYGEVKLKGIYRYKKQDRYKVEIRYQDKYYYLGVFNTKEEAVLAYNKAAIDIYGPNAVLNDIQ